MFSNMFKYTSKVLFLQQMDIIIMFFVSKQPRRIPEDSIFDARGSILCDFREPFNVHFWRSADASMWIFSPYRHQGYKKDSIDGLAAKIILETWFIEHRTRYSVFSSIRRINQINLSTTDNQGTSCEDADE